VAPRSPDPIWRKLVTNPLTIRVKAEKTEKDGDILEAKKEAYKPSEQRKTDQAAVDTQVCPAGKFSPSHQG